MSHDALEGEAVLQSIWNWITSADSRPYIRLNCEQLVERLKAFIETKDIEGIRKVLVEIDRRNLTREKLSDIKKLGQKALAKLMSEKDNRSIQDGKEPKHATNEPTSLTSINGKRDSLGAYADNMQKQEVTVDKALPGEIRMDMEDQIRRKTNPTPHTRSIEEKLAASLKTQHACASSLNEREDTQEIPGRKNSESETMRIASLQNPANRLTNIISNRTDDSQDKANFSADPDIVDICKYACSDNELIFCIREDKWTIPIAEMGLPSRVYNRLRSCGIQNLRDLDGLSYEYIQGRRGIGPKTFQVLLSYLESGEFLLHQYRPTQNGIANPRSSALEENSSHSLECKSVGDHKASIDTKVNEDKLITSSVIEAAQPRSIECIVSHPGKLEVTSINSLVGASLEDEIEKKLGEFF